MRLRNFFSRNKEADVVTSKSETQNSKISCDTEELKFLITKWTRNEGWEFDNFADFIELIGVKTPVKLSEYNEEDNSFKCVTALNTEIRISLFFGDWFDFCSEIRVTEGEETRCYITNYNDEKGKSVPKVTLQSKNIKRNGKEMKSFYSEYFCHRTLKLDENHVLEVEIDEPDKYDEKSEVFVLRNCADIEEYLLGLDKKSLIITEVYDKVMKFLAFSDKDISNCEKILLSYIETVNKEQRVRGKISLRYGEMQEFAILEKGETYHVFKDGSWKYLSDSGIRIVYLEGMKHYVFSVTGSEEGIETVNPVEIMSHVKTKISEMWKFVK